MIFSSPAERFSGRWCRAPSRRRRRGSAKWRRESNTSRITAPSVAAHFAAGGQYPGQLRTHVQVGRLDPGQREGEEQQGHQEVKDALQHPGGELGGDRNLFLAGDQVGAHELAGAAEQGDGGEADDGGGQQVAHGGMGLQRLQKDGPAQGPPPIGAEDGDQGEGHPVPVDVGEGAAGELPIEGQGIRTGGSGAARPAGPRAAE